MGEGDLNSAFSLTPVGLRALLEHVDEVVVCCDDDGTVRFVSEAFRTLLGYAPELFVGRNITEIVHPDQVAHAVDALTRWQGRRGTPRGEPITVRAADGNWVDVHYDAAVGQDFGGIGSLVLTLRLESSLNLVERELRARALNDDRIVRLSSAFLNLPTEDFEKGLDIAVDELASLESVTRVSVWRTDGDRMVRRAIWEASAGAPTYQLPDRVRREDYATLRRAAEAHDTLLMEPWERGPEFATEREAFLESGVTSCLVSPMMAGGEFVGTVMLETTLPDEFGAVHVGAAHSACAVLAEAFLRNDAERLLARQARIDRVTGLSNRWVFDVDLECALEELRTGLMNGLALSVIDLDRFKAVNDTFGHAVGDHLLAEAGLRLRHRSDGRTSVARLGGDEMLVLIQDVEGPDEAVTVVEELLSTFRVPFNLPNGALGLTASAGVAHTADGDTEMGDLMARADVAMYQVKSAGGDAVALADPDSHIERSQRLRRESDLHRAIRAGTLLVHYQPEIDLSSGRLLGAEALIRWQHPRSGLLTAAEFVPLIESTAMIETVGRQVLGEACDAAARWRRQIGGSPFLMRVNVAARQLRQENFVEQVADVLADTGLPASALCLELTESTLLTDPAVAVERFRQLRELGVGLAIDDFGIGYSSFLQLRSLPLTALKVDRSFVTDLPESATDRAIVSATLDLAGALGLTVTAEGVETEAQHAVLVELGCPAAQGYLLGRPMPEPAFDALVGPLD